MVRPTPPRIAQVDVLQREHFVVEEDRLFPAHFPRELTAHYRRAFQGVRQRRADIAPVKHGQRLPCAGQADVEGPAIFLLLHALWWQPPRADEQDVVIFGAFCGMDRAERHALTVSKFPPALDAPFVYEFDGFLHWELSIS